MRPVLNKNKSQEAQRTRLPMAPELLLKIRKEWRRTLESMTSLCCGPLVPSAFLFFLNGEITAPSDKAFDLNDHLAFGDITVDCTTNPSIVRVRLKRSKTDPFCWGMDAFVGRTRNALRPVSAMLAFLAV